jgi:cbb3-type cytochrome oxidase maturation protein
MSVILILIIASLSLALAFLAGFIWAVKSGQFEDTYTPSMRILLDEQTQRTPEGRALSGLDSPAARKISCGSASGKPTGGRRSDALATPVLNKSDT